ncbi:MAG: flagellar hook protein [Roseburia sp.]|nr:flagellar hook protein [Roseburia sp.]
MVVQHNLTAMNSNRMLGLTTAAQAKSTEKLSSGYKINRAADDAAGLSISEKMRKQIRGLTQASLNAQDGISAVQTAEGALTEVHDMLQRMNELAVKAANGSNSVDDREYIQNEIDQLVTEIDRVAETTKFNETYLLKGDKTATKNTVKYSETETPSTAEFMTGITKLYEADGMTEITDGDALKAYLDGDSSAKVIKTPASVTGGTEASKGSDYEITEAKVVDSSNADVGSAYVKDSDDQLSGEALIQAVKDGKELYSSSSSSGQTDTDKLALSVVDAKAEPKDGKKILDEDGKELDSAGILAADKANTKMYTKAPTKTDAVYAKAGTDYTYTPAGKPALYDANGNKISENGLDSYIKIKDDGTYEMKEGKKLYKDNEMGTEFDPAADADTYLTTAETVAALDLDLHVGADATENNQISMKIEAMSAEGLGVKDLKVNGATDANALDAIETIKAAIQRVSTQRSALGAIQNRLEHTINNLDNVVENTTSAESQIRDTDMATEMVKYSNNNILAQAGQAMLAQANQSNQGVLSLLG